MGATLTQVARRTFRINHGPVNGALTRTNGHPSAALYSRIVEGLVASSHMERHHAISLSKGNTSRKWYIRVSD